MTTITTAEAPTAPLPGIAVFVGWDYEQEAFHLEDQTEVITVADQAAPPISGVSTCHATPQPGPTGIPNHGRAVCGNQVRICTRGWHNPNAREDWKPHNPVPADHAANGPPNRSPTLNRAPADSLQRGDAAAELCGSIRNPDKTLQPNSGDVRPRVPSPDMSSSPPSELVPSRSSGA